MENYYDFLGLATFESDQSKIKKSYQAMLDKLDPKKYQNRISGNNREQLIEVNVAYLVLSDIDAKSIYDRAIPAADFNDPELVSLIEAKRQKAESFVNSYFDGSRQKKRMSTWQIIGTIFLCLTFIGSIAKGIAACSRQAPAPVTELGSFSAPSDWDTYTVNNSFSISVPPSIELRKEYDQYSQFLSDSSVGIDASNVVFQQNGLESMSDNAMKSYCRIMAEHYNKYDLGGDLIEHRNESPAIMSSDKKTFRELADAEKEPWAYIQEPTYSWVSTNGNNALRISYSRTGDKGEVICNIYLFMNLDEMVKIVTAYRKADEQIWGENVRDVIRTFQWSNPH